MVPTVLLARSRPEFPRVRASIARRFVPFCRRIWEYVAVLLACTSSEEMGRLVELTKLNVGLPLRLTAERGELLNSISAAGTSLNERVPPRSKTAPFSITG